MINDLLLAFLAFLVMSHSLASFTLQVPYTAAAWTSILNPIPASIIKLCIRPTPIHTIKSGSLNTGDSLLWIKRDDLSGFELSGNKVRKLEFLLADALNLGNDCVVTIGGKQSNHARATAVAARQLGLDSHLILRTHEPNSDPGLIGNLLFNRLVGSRIHTVSPSNYAQLGHTKLVNILAQQLREQGKNPYCIPVGGSNAMGTWGYLEAVNELIEQMKEMSLHFDHLVVACGSGGTACGLALGVKLAGLNIKVHAMAVCDSPAYFYNHLQGIATQLGLPSTFESPQQWCTVHPAQGIGYAKSTREELQFITDISRSTGIVLDPVYSGKALYTFNKMVLQGEIEVKPEEKILFWHTGGGFGLFDKCDQLAELFPREEVNKLNIL